MKIYNVITDARIVKIFYEKTNIKLNYLISYAALQGQAYRLTQTYRPMIDSLFLDSGVYSKNTRQSNITLTGYKEYVKMFGKEYDFYFNFDDKFDDPDHNAINQSEIEKELSSTDKLIPVLHHPTDIVDEAKYYLDKGYKYLAAGSPEVNKHIKIEDLLKIREKFPKIKLHVFGSLKKDMLRTVRPFSVDASTWTHIVAKGEIKFWYLDNKEMCTIYMEEREKKNSGKKPPHYYDYHEFPYKDALDHFLFTKFNYEYPDLLRAEGRYIVTLYFFWQLQNFISDLSKP